MTYVLQASWCARNPDMPPKKRKRIDQRASEEQDRSRRRRSKETVDHQTERKASNNERTARARSCETHEQTARRQESNRRRMTRTRSADANRSAHATTEANRRREQSSSERDANLLSAKERRCRGSLPRPAFWRGAALRYNPQIDYAARQDTVIGTMNSHCSYCNALKFVMEAPGLCCCNGKVILDDLQYTPEPLHSLIHGDHPDSAHFLNNIRTYNCAFQMTSFGHQNRNSSGFMPTFKIQGQVYHRIGSLLPMDGNNHSFLQIYFMGDSDAEANRRAQVVPGTKITILRILQGMLHVNNRYIREFKTALQRLQMQPSEASYKIVIRADKTPAQEHQRCYNSPESNEVAVLIAGHNENTHSRDIVLERENSQLQRISELHPWYDALQYPLLFPCAEDGYCISICQVDPVTRRPKGKTVSAMAFYAFRLMVRPNKSHILLRGRMLFNQYIVDMYAKVSLHVRHVTEQKYVQIF